MGDFFRLGKCKADVDRRVAFILILDFRFRQCRAAVEAPVDRLQAAIDIAFFQDGAERADLVGFVAESHGQVGVVPFAQDA